MSLQDLQKELRVLQTQQDKLRVRIEAAIEAQKVKPDDRTPHLCVVSKREWRVEPYKVQFGHNTPNLVVHEGLHQYNNMKIVIYGADRWDFAGVVKRIPEPTPFKPYAAVRTASADIPDPRFNIGRVFKAYSVEHGELNCRHDGINFTAITNPVEAIRILHECLGEESPHVERSAVVERLKSWCYAPNGSIARLIADIEGHRI
jgi:hypothetical protein